MAVVILGISAYYHDAAAALLVDGEIAAAAQEERFTRIKGDARFPHNAVLFCLEENGIDMAAVDHVIFYEKPFVKFDRLLTTYRALVPRGFASFQAAIPLWTSQKLRLRQRLVSELPGRFRGEVSFSVHHESHAASAFFPSPFEEAAILVLDAVGEWSTGSIGLGRGNRVELLVETRFPHSLGMLYSAFTYYTGFKVNSGEYKLMGLAPYGEPRYVDVILERLARLYDDGSLWLDQSYFNYCQGLTMTSEKFHDLFGGPPRLPESRILQRHMDLAASIQVVCERVVMNAARHAHELIGSRNLVMAGGVALNCVANGKLLREGPFERIWIQPAAGDAGGALGAAYVLWHHRLGNKRRLASPDAQRGSLLGPSFGNDDIGLFLDSVGATYEFIADESLLLDRAARLLAEEKVVGWFHGAAEFGPRALGCRSILGDPRSPRMQSTMNLKIKMRESFRPFAPCVLREFASSIFELPAHIDSPYMLLVAPVRDAWRLPLDEAARTRMRDPDLTVRVSVPRSTLPAITHVDFSARIQTVDDERHGRFYRLMQRFHKLTGCPVLVNTSFNIRGEPIVNSPEDAYRCFTATEMDYLVLENYLLERTVQPAHWLAERDRFRARYAPD